jgi:hypothetical protein
VDEAEDVAGDVGCGGGADAEVAAAADDDSITRCWSEDLMDRKRHLDPWRLAIWAGLAHLGLAWILALTEGFSWNRLQMPKTTTAEMMCVLMTVVHAVSSDYCESPTQFERA